MDLLEAFANLDWISSTKAIFETVFHGPFSGHTFYVGLDSGYTGAQCERILKEHGISIYARCIAKGDAFFTVSNDKAEEAERILLLAGAPLKYHLFSERNRRYLR